MTASYIGECVLIGVNIDKILNFACHIEEIIYLYFVKAKICTMCFWETFRTCGYDMKENILIDEWM